MSWFKKLFGFNEFVDTTENYQKTKINFSVNKNVLTSKITNKKYNIGTFDNKSIENLKKIVNNLDNNNPGNPTFKCKIVGDIFLVHSKEENKGALFHGASQFNCLEFSSETVIPENGITNYVYDKTQGPACSLATAPGAVYRNYFCDVKTIDGKIQQGQTKDCQINNLIDIQTYLKKVYGSEFITVKNGYTESSVKNLTELNKHLVNNKELKNILINKLKVGVHSDLEVVFKNKWEILNKPDFLVTQVYTSALSIGYSNIWEPEAWYPLAEIILNATYEAVIYLGIINFKKTNNPKIYLTLIGGGVFQNPPKLICKAIKRALKIAEKHKYPIEIICCFYNEYSKSEYTDLWDNKKKVIKRKVIKSKKVIKK